MKDVMIDLETWNNTSDAVVVQIGACYFDRDTKEIGKEFEIHVDATTEIQRGFTIGADTLYWWFTQSSAAQRLAMGNERSRKLSMAAWRAFNHFLKGAESIWSHGSFDFPIVNTHMKKLGIVPAYKYWAGKDLRTLVDLAGIDHRAYKKKAGVGVLHNALDDCKIQVDYAVDAMRRLIEG